MILDLVLHPLKRKGKYKKNVVTMEFKVKAFEDLTVHELYMLLKARSEVFVVEQNCIYQDLDDLDLISLHLFLEEDGKVLACLRAYRMEQEKVVKVGRVLSTKRQSGLGRRIMELALPVIIERLQPEKLYIHAQQHAAAFYEKFGFKTVSEPFMEDGIIHVAMEAEPERLVA